MVLFFLGVVAIFALLSVIRRQNNLLVSENGDRTETRQEPKWSSVATRNV